MPAMDSDGFSDPYCMLCLSKSKPKGKVTALKEHFKELKSAQSNTKQNNELTQKETSSPFRLKKTSEINRQKIREKHLGKTQSSQEMRKIKLMKLSLSTNSERNAHTRTSEGSHCHRKSNSTNIQTPTCSSPASGNWEIPKSGTISQIEACNYSKHEQISMLKRAKLLQKYVMQEKVQMKQSSISTGSEKGNLQVTSNKPDTTTYQEITTIPKRAIERHLSLSGDSIGVLGPDGLIIYRTRVVNKSLSPYWNETFHLYELSYINYFIYYCNL